MCRRDSPRSAAVVPRRAGAAAIGVGMAVAVVTVPTLHGGDGSLDAVSGPQPNGLALAELSLADAPTTFVTRVNSSLSASRSRTRESCLLYTSDAADERSSVDLGGRRIIKKKKDKR